MTSTAKPKAPEPDEGADVIDGAVQALRYVEEADQLVREQLRVELHRLVDVRHVESQLHSRHHDLLITSMIIDALIIVDVIISVNGRVLRWPNRAQ